MAQNNNSEKKIARARSRKERLAAQAAAEAAQREQEERDRKTQTAIGVAIVAVVAIVALVVGFLVVRNFLPSSSNSSSSASEAYSALQAVKTKPANATKKGGFVISKNGVNKPVANVPTIEDYMDFLCPGCGTMNRAIDETLIKMVKAGQINLEIHPGAYLDSLSNGHKYSTRTASMVSYIADNDPQNVLAFIQALFAEDFQPSESSYKNVTNATLVKLAISSGVKESVAKASISGKYTKWITAVSKYTPLRSALWNVSGSSKGSMTTPTIRINKHYWDLQVLNTASIDYLTGLLKAIGLSSSDVGNSSVLPSIGSTKKPISLTS